MAIEAVVFDIGNVLVEWYPERPFDRLLGEIRRKELFAAVDFEGANIRSDLGADMYEEVDALARAQPDLAGDILIWSKHWMEMLAPDLKRSAQMLRALRAKGMPVFALSNFGVPTLALAEVEYPILKEFDQRFISGAERVMKPDPAFYEILERETGVAPEALFFIDDRSDNIAAAKARGWQGHLFETEAGLAKRLVAEGLLNASEAGI